MTLLEGQVIQGLAMEDLYEHVNVLLDHGQSHDIVGVVHIGQLAPEQALHGGHIGAAMALRSRKA
jgi:hypothetical protein